MQDTSPQPLNSQEPGQPGAATQAGFGILDAYRSLVRLIVGLALIGGDDLFARLREWEAAALAASAAPAPESTPAPQSPTGYARAAIAGVVSEGAEAARQVVRKAADGSAALTGAVTSVLEPLTGSALFRPLRSTAGWATRAGRAEAQRCRDLAAGVTDLLLEDIVGFAGSNPGVKSLVDAQIDRLLPVLVTDSTIQSLLVEQLGTWITGLATRPETLDPLVRELGDRYIAYLNEHPDDVQNLIQGQAMGMASEVRDSVRTTTVTGDNALELVVRALLRRTPRENLPPPNIPNPYASTGSLPAGEAAAAPTAPESAAPASTALTSLRLQERAA
jgi:hypothetical protein